MTEQKLQHDLEEVANFAYRYLQRAINSGGVENATLAEGAYSAAVSIVKRELEIIQIRGGHGGMDMGLWGRFYGTDIILEVESRKGPSSNPFRPLYPFFAEFFYGQGAASGLADSLKSKKPNPRDYRRAIVMFSEEHLVPNEMIAYGYTMGYDKSPDILHTLGIIRGPKRPLPK